MFVLRSRCVCFIRQYSFQSKFSKEILCSMENREKCLKHIQKTVKKPSFDMKTTTFAAVLIPVVYESDTSNLSLLYTLRSNKLRKHVRQVSFPGGIRDLDDASFVECALRETEEEIGLSRDNIQVWGEGQFFRTLNGPVIMPVIGFIDNYQPDKLKLNPDEVEKVFVVPIKHLCSSRCRQHTQFRSNQGYSLPVFTCGEERIWGITAIITNLFLQSLLPREIYRSHIKFIPNYENS